MCHKKRETALLLAGLLLLSSCTSREIRKYVPKGIQGPAVSEPEATETASPVKEKQPDFTGEWHRTGCRQECGATLVISDQTDDGFLVSADCCFYGNTGKWDSVPVLFVDEGIATAVNYWKNKNTYAHRVRIKKGYDSGPVVRFSYIEESDQLYVHTVAGYDDLEFDAFVTIAGTYTRGEPEYRPDLVEEYLTEEEQKTLRTLLGEKSYLWSIVRPINVGEVEQRDVEDPRFLAEDRVLVKMLTLQYPNNDMEVELILTEDGRAYCAYNGRFYTNDPVAVAMPEIWPQNDGMNGHFYVDTGGKWGKLLFTTMNCWDEADKRTKFEIWDLSDLSAPIQTIMGEGPWYRVADADFDGYMDLLIEYYDSETGEERYHFWLWDEEIGQFATHAGLEAMPNFMIDEEHGVFLTEELSRIYIAHKEIYKWVDGEPLCVRRIERTEDGERGRYVLSVEDRKGKSFTRVFYREYAYAEDGTAYESWWDTYMRWCDPDYHGE